MLITIVVISWFITGFFCYLWSELRYKDYINVFDLGSAIYYSYKGYIALLDIITDCVYSYLEKKDWGDKIIFKRHIK